LPFLYAAPSAYSIPRTAVLSPASDTYTTIIGFKLLKKLENSRRQIMRYTKARPRLDALQGAAGFERGIDRKTIKRKEMRENRRMFTLSLERTTAGC
jgi:hypothetical protein